MTDIQPSPEFPLYQINSHIETFGCEMFVAVWTNRGRGVVMIGAPSLERLRERWEQITNSDLNPELAQCVVMIHANKLPPSSTPEIAI